MKKSIFFHLISSISDKDNIFYNISFIYPIFERLKAISSDKQKNKFKLFKSNPLSLNISIKYYRNGCFIFIL